MNDKRNNKVPLGDSAHFFKDVNKRINPIKLALLRNLHKKITIKCNGTSIQGTLVGFNDFLNLLVRTQENKPIIFRNYDSCSLDGDGENNQHKPVAKKQDTTVVKKVKKGVEKDGSKKA